MINNIVLVGRTTKAIELKQNKNGTNYVQFTLAVNRPYKDEQGGQQADFITCVAWNKTAETIANYVLKGTLIGVEGRLQVRNYENEAGVRQYLSEVLVNRFTFLESKKSSTIPEPVEPFNPAMESNINPFDPNFSNPNYSPTSQNYNNPFTTATTLAGSLNRAMNPISVSDDDLPF
ncbi:single-stranded DNA-binding protein [Turicibacter sp. T129]|uniref:single-stranded DNA-binding protein n=1 Tax=Turicibacter sp. T129 TaxID=2951141 RepID=UPI0021D4C0CA|nr:single-stranded DNA-binding protein [Turicibacter sp. T129]MCU7193049.1 single-stranded DNA-binding protein [Turicibacter sp. T129]